MHRWKKNSWFIFLGYGYILAKYISLKFDQWNLLLIKKRTLHDRSPAATACPPLHHSQGGCRIGSTIRTYYLPLGWNLKFDPARGVDVVARRNNPQGGNTHNDSWCKLSGICNMGTTRLPRLIKGDMLGGCQSFMASWHRLSQQFSWKKMLWTCCFNQYLSFEIYGKLLCRCVMSKIFGKIAGLQQKRHVPASGLYRKSFQMPQWEVIQTLGRCLW